jgi:hypothetical protein
MATSELFFPLTSMANFVYFFPQKLFLHFALDSCFCCHSTKFHPKKKKNTECDQVAEARSPNLLPPLNVELFLLLSHNIHFSLIQVEETDSVCGGEVYFLPMQGAHEDHNENSNHRHNTHRTIQHEISLNTCLETFCNSEVSRILIALQ